MHCYIIGASGTGKSTFMASQIIEAISRGEGVAVFDPHGSLIDTVLSRFPKRRLRDAILVDPSDLSHPIAWNPLAGIPKDIRPLLAKAIQATFRDIWDYDRMPTPDIDLAVYNGTRALLDVPDGTLLGLFRLIIDPAYRKEITAHIKDPVVRAYFRYFQGYTAKEQRDRERSTLNKIEILMADPHVRNVLGQPVSSFSVLDVLDKGQCLFVRLPQGVLGVEGTRAIGSLLLTTLHHVALGRKSRQPFTIYLDECHHFGAHTLSEMLSGIRKFGINLTLAHQYLSQLPDKLKSSILGNAGRRYLFRVGIEDSAELLRTIPQNNNAILPHDLPNFTARVFEGEETDNVTVLPLPEGRNRGAVVTHSRATYASRRKHVEERIEKFLGASGGSRG